MFPKEIIKKSKELGLYGTEAPKEKSRLLKLVYPYIKRAKEEGASYKTILERIEKDFNISYALPSFKNAIKNIEKNKTDNNIQGDSMKKELKKVAVINFKGGVGKSTIANILDLPNKVVINLDTQNAENSNYADTINYLKLKEENGLELNEIIEFLKEENKNWVVFDTPGSITDELVEIIDDVDYVIIPFTKGNRSKETTLDTIKAINEFIENDKVKFALILNMYQDDEDIKEELEPLEKQVKKILGDKYKCSAALKFSKVVSTMEKTKKSVDELNLTNKVAYKAFKKRVKELNEKLNNCLFAKERKIIKYEIDFKN